MVLTILVHSRVVPVAGSLLLAIGIRAQKHASPRAEPLRAVFRRKYIPGGVGTAGTVHILAYFHRSAENREFEREACEERETLSCTHELSPTT
jgi:hypothetical protein